MAEKIFGTDVSTLKGRTTRKMAKVVVDNFIEIPRELIGNNLELIMCMEIMFINKQAFFITLDRDIKFCGLVTLANMKMKSVTGIYM